MRVVTVLGLAILMGCGNTAETQTDATSRSGHSDAFTRYTHAFPDIAPHSMQPVLPAPVSSHFLTECPLGFQLLEVVPDDGAGSIVTVGC